MVGWSFLKRFGCIISLVALRNCSPGEEVNFSLNLCFGRFVFADNFNYLISCIFSPHHIISCFLFLRWLWTTAFPCIMPLNGAFLSENPRKSFTKILSICWSKLCHRYRECHRLHLEKETKDKTKKMENTVVQKEEKRLPEKTQRIAEADLEHVRGPG